MQYTAWVLLEYLLYIYVFLRCLTQAHLVQSSLYLIIISHIFVRVCSDIFGRKGVIRRDCGEREGLLKPSNIHSRKLEEYARVGTTMNSMPGRSMPG